MTFSSHSLFSSLIHKKTRIINNSINIIIRVSDMMVDGFESRPHLINFLQTRRGERAPENEASFKACRWWRRKMIAHPSFTVPKPFFFKCCGLRCWHTIEGDDSSPLLFSVAGRWGFKIRGLLSLDCDSRFYRGGFRSPSFFPPGNKSQFC